MAPESQPRPAENSPRPRVSQACTRCRTGKMRCDGQTPTCSPCAARGHRCVYPATQRMRGPGKSKQRIEALEERLAAMESMLRERKSDSAANVPSAGTPSNGSGGAVHDVAGGSPVSPSASPSASPSPPTGQGDTPSLEGIAPRFRRISARLALVQREDCTKPLRRTPLSPLTADEPELWVVAATLDDVCAELPFLPVPRFLELVRRPGAVAVPDAWWQAALNALVASGLCLKTVNASLRESTAAYLWAFFRNAYAVLPELILHGDSLGAAQALMAMAVFVRNSADTRTTALLLSMAVRMQHSAGLHVRAAAESTVGEEERGRLFWSAFILDMDMTVNTGLPPLHVHHEAAAVDVPGWDWLDSGATLRDRVFQLRAALAEVQVRIAAQLNKPTHAGLDTLDSDLEAWRLQVPPGIRPSRPEHEHGQPGAGGVGSEPGAAEGAERADRAVAMLHLVYYNSLSMICWASVRHAMGQMANGPPQIVDPIAQDRINSRMKVARAAARAVIGSLSRFPTDSFTELWKALCYPLSASIALLALICREPAQAQAPQDVSLLSCFVGFLDDAVRRKGCDLERMRDGVAAFERVASHAVGAALAASGMPFNPALWPLSLASGHTARAIATLLSCSTYHPMYIAQSFMGNTPNRDTANARKLAEILGLPWGQGGYGPFVPDSLMPATHGFAFGSPG